MEGSCRYKLPSPDFRTTIRGINLQGVDFDSLEPVDPSTCVPALRCCRARLTRSPCPLVLDGITYEAADDWFEDGIQCLERALPPGVQLVCCVTCLFSDYSPGGHGLTGIRCHREAKEQYLAVRSKTDYWPVPVTEEVPETYLCEEYQRRIPGTGYRG